MILTFDTGRLGATLVAVLTTAGLLGATAPAAAQTAAAVAIDIPAQPLASALRLLARQTSQQLFFSPELVGGKAAPAVRGSLAPQAALALLLAGTGLEAVAQSDSIVLRTAQAVSPNPLPAMGEEGPSVSLGRVIVRGKRAHDIGPLPGLGLTKEQIPGNVQSISAEEIKQARSLSLADLMNRKLQSVTVNDYQGNPFQMDVQYRGFTAGPQIGSPQGLSVFFDGIRVNEPFGDVVNWDLIPMNAVASLDVFPGSNPIFGLNTLGGALTVRTKDGFANSGLDVDLLGGSYGRRQFQIAKGWNDGERFALFGAGNFFLEDGWRRDSPSKVNQFFGKASYRGDKLDLNLATTIVRTDLVGNGLVPSDMVAQDRRSVFTSPDETTNKLAQLQLSGAFAVNEQMTVTGQAYRRKSRRHAVGADVFTDWDEDLPARRRPNPGEEHTCVFKSTNRYGIPDYMVYSVNVTKGQSLFSSDLWNEYFANGGQIDLKGKYASNVNATLPDYYATGTKKLFDVMKNIKASIYNRSTPLDDYSLGPNIEINDSGFITTEASFVAGTNYFTTNPGGNGQFDAASQTIPGENIALNGGVSNFYYSKSGTDDVKNYVFVLPAINRDKCQQDQGLNNDQPGPYIIRTDSGVAQLVDGFALDQPGTVDGTPTAVFNDNRIDQTVDGASLQFNWTLPRHKLALGASIDSAGAAYINTAQLGFLDGNRKAYLDPDQAHPQFAAAYQPLINNEFSGTNTTKSLYVSETWSPKPAWSFNGSARYNHTVVRNTIAARHGLFAYGPGDLIAFPNDFDTCSTDAECAAVETNYRKLTVTDTLGEAGTEVYRYRSLNPSLGATWQVRPDLNTFVNWSRSTRTPSVIELGCGFDKTPVFTGGDPTNPANYTPRSLQENRQCSLPTILSGDPYLPQIKAATYDIGARGNLGPKLQWNLGAYQTDLRDDIYFVTVMGKGFFDTIGKTRRRGLEAGLSGEIGRARFSVNYSYTDATFQSDFLMINQDNSSSFELDGYGQVIRVKPGDRMPGVSRHNLNSTVSFDLMPEWSVALNTVMHSNSFVRGNENNEHQPGVTRYVTTIYGTQALQPTSNPGTVPGYAVFNLQTTVKPAPAWSVTLQINNLFDTRYFSAGRLGRNPFSPSIHGAIGPDGYNHNSGDWLSTNFIAPGSPRAAYLSVNYTFDR